MEYFGHDDEDEDAGMPFVFKSFMLNLTKKVN